MHLETPGVATMLGGILLTFPGFITDVAGRRAVLAAHSPLASCKARDAGTRPAPGRATIASSTSNPTNGTKFRISADGAGASPRAARDILVRRGPCVSHAATAVNLSGER